MAKRTVVFGLLGSTLDTGKKAQRWDRWRPTVDICRHEDLVVDRLELLYPSRQAALCDVVQADIEEVSPETEVRRHAPHPELTERRTHLGPDPLHPNRVGVGCSNLRDGIPFGHA